MLNANTLSMLAVEFIAYALAAVRLIEGKTHGEWWASP